MKTMRSVQAAALALAMAWIRGPTVQAQDAVTLQDLDQKVRGLERKLELADEAAAAKAKESPSLTAGKDGFALTSSDKGYQLKLRGYSQVDARFYGNDGEKKLADTLVLRRARMIFDARLGKQFEFRLAPDFGAGTVQLQDGYVDYKPSAPANLRLGRAKVPFGLERLQSNAETLFNETALPTALTPNYELGALVYGSVRTGLVDYALGIINGGPDGASVDADTNDGKDLVARLFATPFKTSDMAALKGLSLGIAGTFGPQRGATNAPGLPSLRTSGQQSFFSYKTSTNSADTAIADGDRARWSPQIYYVIGPASLLGEYVASEQDVANGKGSASLKNEAWQLAASFVLTGESPSLKGVQPANPFDPANGKWGAFELAARIDSLTVDDEAFSGGYADIKKSAKSADSWGAGINWYLTRNARFSVDYVQTSFEGGAATGDRPDEQVVLARAQVAF